MIIATLAVLAQTAAGFSPRGLQIFPGPTTFRRIEVNAQTIAALPSGKNYVVDLTQRGVAYEFSSQTGQIDFSRVRVRTAQGEVAIGSFLETTFLKDKLAGFKYTTRAFSLATRPPGTLQNPPTGTSNFDCNPDLCSCTGKRDCELMIAFSFLCGGKIFCTTDGQPGDYFCYCSRTQ
jgi:hypothetical protein